MEHGFSWILAWQTGVPVVAGIIGLLLPGWLSHRWRRAAAARSARVSNQLGRPSVGEETSPWSENEAKATR
jgi:hypothetical protein